MNSCPRRDGGEHHREHRLHRQGAGQRPSIDAQLRQPGDHQTEGQVEKQHLDRALVAVGTPQHRDRRPGHEPRQRDPDPARTAARVAIAHQLVGGGRRPGSDDRVERHQQVRVGVAHMERHPGRCGGHNRQQVEPRPAPEDHRGGHQAGDAQRRTGDTHRRVASEGRAQVVQRALEQRGGHHPDSHNEHHEAHPPQADVEPQDQWHQAGGGDDRPGGIHEIVPRKPARIDCRPCPGRSAS